MQSILIVEDDVIICGGIKVYLENHGYEAFCVYSVSEAKDKLNRKYDLVVLDVNIPVIFLTANDTENDMIEGFKYGCDDYISKPFSVEILNQRIKAVLRRSQGSKQNDIFCYKNLSVDFYRMQAALNNRPIKLSVTEFKLLELLIKNKGQVLTRNSIIEKIWDCNENFVDENTLNVHIRRLRRKIESDPKNPEYIITVFGIGYTFGE